MEATETTGIKKILQKKGKRRGHPTAESISMFPFPNYFVSIA
jgi:hypothetical protein